MKQLIQIALEDICECFGIEENLYEKYYEGEILKDEGLVEFIDRRNNIRDWTVETPLGGPGTVLNGVVLYCLIRHYGMEFVLETGVAAGSYSTFILYAVYGPDGMGRTNYPCVRSIELSDDEKEVGKLVPEKVKVDWDLIIGTDSLKYLKENGQYNRAMQLYCHDSLHTMSHMMKELQEFKKCELDRFFIFVDDETSDNFWSKCVKTNAFHKPGYTVKYISGAESRLRGHLGGFLKYEKA